MKKMLKQKHIILVVSFMACIIYGTTVPMSARDGFFVELAGEWTPAYQSIDGPMISAFGAGAALGYTFDNNVDVALASAFSSRKDTEESVVYGMQIPVLLKAGYTLPLSVLSIKVEAYGGVMISPVTQYVDGTGQPNIIGRYTHNTKDVIDVDLDFGAGAYLVWTFAGDRFSMFAGATYSLLVDLQRKQLGGYYPQARLGVILRPGRQKKLYNPGGGAPVTAEAASGGSAASETRAAATKAATKSQVAKAPANNVKENDPKTEAELAALRRDLEALQKKVDEAESVKGGGVDSTVKIASSQSTSGANANTAGAAGGSPQNPQIQNSQNTQSPQSSTQNAPSGNSAAALPPLPVVKAASEQPLATEKLVVGENFWTVYFIEDQVVLMESSNRMLDTIGAVLTRNPDAKLTIRGYAYARGTQASQRRISEQRAQYCAQYLQKNFGISAARLKVEWNGADKAPVLAITTNATTYRAVELFLTK